MKNKDEIKNELNEISPFLSNLKNERKEGFSVPENYFDNFESRLMSRIKEEEALSGSIESNESDKSIISRFLDMVQLIFTPKYAVSFATAMVLLVFGIQFFGNTDPVNNNEPLLIAQLSAEETSTFILNNIEDFSIDDILELVESEDIEDIHTELPSLDQQVTPEDISTEDNRSAFDKALESADAENLLDDLSDEDFDDEYTDGYF